MRNPWRFFLIIEALLALFLLWQVSSNPPVLIMVVFGSLNIYFGLRKQRRRKFQLILGLLIVGICLVNSPATWLMLIFAVLFIGLKGFEISGVSVSGAFSNKKNMVIVETSEPTEHRGECRKQTWIGNERIGSQVFEWDDINLNVLAGDTIVDLGNTLLPKEDSIVIVRKGFGRTRVLIPYGIGVVLEHATIFGTVRFDGEEIALKNESVKLYSEDYDDSPRRLKLVTNSFLGDVEVIRV
ncbi:membrane protein [Enterococcus florum]|uniref:Membrane protein n=1 Tax=Enterococcus florum TaxID=2480627 RepID=A0A4V0WP24_9ENTE|nr:cell wall-active antibiotics response protein LiaF [Enterococcus florum]GCF92369.1 membrane protein [Enterococcus florum]